MIGVYHPKWDERPLLVVVKKPDAQVTREELLKFFEGKVAKWWIPDDVVFVDELPHTATGQAAQDQDPRGLQGRTSCPLLRELRIQRQARDVRSAGASAGTDAARETCGSTSRAQASSSSTSLPGCGSRKLATVMCQRGRNPSFARRAAIQRLTGQASDGILPGRLQRRFQLEPRDRQAVGAVRARMLEREAGERQTVRAPRARGTSATSSS